MNAADLPSSSLTSDLVTSDHTPSVVGDTRTFQEPSPSKNPGSVKVFPSGLFTSAVKSTLNGLPTLTLDLKTKSCGCQRGTSTRLAALAEMPIAANAMKPSNVIRLNCFWAFISNFIASSVEAAFNLEKNAKRPFITRSQHDCGGNSQRDAQVLADGKQIKL